MYFEVNDRVGEGEYGYGEQERYHGAPLGMAVALPAGLLAAAMAALEALLFVASAIAAAYLLHQALQKAKSVGIGVAWAEEKFNQAFNWVLTQAWRALRALTDTIEKASTGNLPPQCQNFVRLLMQHLSRLRVLLGNPSGPNREQWLEQVRGTVKTAETLLNSFINECLKA